MMIVAVGAQRTGGREGDREEARACDLVYHSVQGGASFRKDVGRQISKLLRGNFGLGSFEIAVPQERKEGRKRARSK